MVAINSINFYYHVVLTFKLRIIYLKNIFRMDILLGEQFLLAVSLASISMAVSKSVSRSL